MGPKNKKEQELEAQRLLEEQKAREEEEKRRREEEERRYNSRELEGTGLLIVLTEFYVQECLTSRDPSAYTRQFVDRFLRARGVLENFRKIDLDVITDFNLYNLRFASIDLNFDALRTAVFINIMWEVLRNGDARYTTAAGAGNGKVSSNKDRESDLRHFRALLQQHAVDNEGTRSRKYFSAGDLSALLEYARTGYFAHHGLYAYVQANEQRTVNKYITVFIDEPTLEGKLEDALYIPIDKASTEGDGRTRTEDAGAGDAHHSNLTEEQQKQLLYEQQQQLLAQQLAAEEEAEKLDPELQAIVNEKLRLVEEEMFLQLETRGRELDAKYEELTAANKGKKGGK